MECKRVWCLFGLGFYLFDAAMMSLQSGTLTSFVGKSPEKYKVKTEHCIVIAPSTSVYDCKSLRTGRIKEVQLPSAPKSAITYLTENLQSFS